MGEEYLCSRGTAQVEGLPVRGRVGVDEEAGRDVSEGVSPDDLVLGESVVVEDRQEEDREEHVCSPLSGHK